MSVAEFLHVRMSGQCSTLTRATTQLRGAPALKTIRARVLRSRAVDTAIRTMNLPGDGTLFLGRHDIKRQTARSLTTANASLTADESHALPTDPPRTRGAPGQPQTLARELALVKSPT